MNVPALHANARYDVLVIGGGVIGMLTARNLRIAGLTVALLEKHQLGGEASWAAAGILSKLYPWQQTASVQRLIAQGQMLFPALVAELKDETGTDAQLLRCGMLIIDVDETPAALAWARNNKVQIELIDGHHLKQLEPHLDQGIHLALHAPSVMQVRPPLLIKAIRQSLRQRGVRIFEGTTVHKLILKSGKVAGVVTDQMTMFAEHNVICSGAWTQRLLQNISDDATDVEPVRGQMLLFKPERNLLTHIIVKDGLYLVPRKDQYILCGSTLEHVGFSKATTATAQRLLSAQARRLCPALSGQDPVRHWSALRPGTTRRLPYVCAHPEYAGLYINAGHFRYGIVMSAPTAKLMADFITNKISAAQISAYAW